MTATVLPPVSSRPGGESRSSSSTTSSRPLKHSASHSTLSSHTTFPNSGHTSLKPAHVITSDSRKNSGASGSSSASGRRSSGDSDELDKAAYTYALRVAALHQRLAVPTPRFSFTSPPQSPALNSSPLISNAGAGSRMTYGSFRSPDITLPSEFDTPPQVIKRKKSALSIRLGRHKDELKLPRELLLDFWTVLSVEGGDPAWQRAVNALLTMVQKKGTKTASGANLREIPTLVETFASCFPPSSAVRPHQTRFLTLLYNFLPTSSYFTGSGNDKDKDLLFRLRAEVQVYLHAAPSSPDPSAKFTPDLVASAHAARAGLGIAASPVLSSSGSIPSSPRRKPSPSYLAAGADLGNLVEAVGTLWGLSNEELAKDVDANQYHGSLEKLYLDDLKKNLTSMSRVSDMEQAQRDRHGALSRKVGDLIVAFPELTAPASPVEWSQSGDAALFFTPPRKNAVFARLCRRVSDSDKRGRELLGRCQEIWEVESRADQERELARLVQQWEESYGSPHEAPCAQQLGGAVADFAGAFTASDKMPPVLQDLYERLMSRLASSLHSIFPTSEIPPPPPSSVISILNAAPELFLESSFAAKAIDSVADELRGGAVMEYVTVAGGMMGGAHSYQYGARLGPSGKDAVVESFEKVAGWLEMEIKNVLKVWGRGLGPLLNPAGIILSKQLPLFLAELQVLETARSAASEVFILYEVTARLLDLSHDVCPTMDLGFDLDAFFEPHVLTWLRETEVHETHRWVSRTVGMDAWIPEGDGRNSQSVADLFDFIRASVKVVYDLPLSDYKRALFLIDLSKTASIAVTYYASAVNSLFMAEMTPSVTSPQKEHHLASIPMSGKASAWFAKGKHAVHKLEQRVDRRRAEGFLVPASACVKVTDMIAAQACLEELGYAMEADETARIVREHKLGKASHAERPARQVYSITVLRGENLLTRGSSKAADALVTVTDKETGERLFKSRTVLETEDPKWEQSFEVSLGASKSLELAVFDRQMVGKHDCIGARTFKVDPALFEDVLVRDIVVPLSPRGVVHLRISTEGGEKHDVAYHLTTAARMLERTCGDMTREIVDRMSEYLKGQLSLRTVAALVKPLRERQRGRVALSDAEIDMSLAPIYDYLDENFSIFTATFTKETRLAVMLQVWRSVVDILISLLIPPLSDKPTARTTLGGPEVDVVFKWLHQLRGFFNAAEGGVEHGVPMAQLQDNGYRDLVMVGQYLDLPTPQLKDRAAAAVGSSASGTSSPLLGLRHLSMGATRERINDDNDRMAEVLLRIVRMRPDTGEFLASNIAALVRAKVARQGGGIF